MNIYIYIYIYILYQLAKFGYSPCHKCHDVTNLVSQGSKNETCFYNYTF